MRVPQGFGLVQNGSGRALVRDDLTGLPLSTWWQAGRPLPGAKGRGGVAVLEPVRGLTAVARTYRRGGALRWLLGDRYLRSGRAFAELSLLAELARRRIPAVKAVAAAIRRQGAFYRLRLVTELADGEVLTEFLASHPELRRQTLHEAGAVVRAAFDARLFHPDLHPDNLLARSSGAGVQVLLMDLDRARLEPALGPNAQDRMLVRMDRYLYRHEASLAAPVGLTDRLRFLRGMGLSRAERKRGFRRLAPLVARAVRIHRLSWRG